MNKLRIIKVLIEMPLIVSFLVLFSISTACAFQWTKTYGRPSYDYAYSIQQTSDGGYIVAGTTSRAAIGDAWILKLDGNGNVQWQKTYGGPSGGSVRSIQQTFDGGYIVAGETWSFGAGLGDAWILKLDGNGNVQWQKTYDGSDNDYAYSIQQTSDGGYIMAGSTYSFGASNGNAWILKLDVNGNVLWQKTYGGSGDDYARSIQQTSDGGYIVGGETWSFGTGYNDAWVLKLDGSGLVQWQKTYGGSDHDSASSIQQTSDGGYIVGGKTASFGAGSYDVWVLKLDGNGNVQWQKTYGGSDYDGGLDYDYASSIQQTSDGGYIVAGETWSFGAGYNDAWVLKLDGSGIVQWQKTYGGSDNDYARSIQQTSDGGYIVAGTDLGLSPGVSTDIWVLKLDANGNINNCSIGNTSNAQVSDTFATVQDTYVTEADSNVSPVTVTASVSNTNAVVTEICYDGPRVSVSPSSLNFGALKVGRSSTPSVITISNTGTTADLHISGMLLWDTVNYSLDVNGGTNPCGSTTQTITANSSCTVTVIFNPTSTGPIDGSLAISSDDTDTPIVNVLFTGMGTLPWCGCEFYPVTTIIPRGGTLGFWADVTNYTIGTWTFYYATKVTTPNGSWYPSSGYLLGPIRVTLTYHESKSKYISHFIPYTAPTGTYTYHGYLGTPGDIWDECTFDFTVTE